MSFDEYALVYDQELRRGLRFAGDEPEWFAEQRVAIVRDRLQRLYDRTQARRGLCSQPNMGGGRLARRPSFRGSRRFGTTSVQNASPGEWPRGLRQPPDSISPTALQGVVEFGCGVGNHIPFLRRAFPGSRIVGLDISRDCLQIAEARHAGPNVRFRTPEEFQEAASVDLLYVNGVFHHLPANQHAEWIEYFRRILRPAGVLAVFDNNPFSLAARLVMKAIPFDRDVVMVNPYRFARLITAHGFAVRSCRFHFIFPRALRFLRRLEATLTALPLGAQYCLLATRCPE